VSNTSSESTQSLPLGASSVSDDHTLRIRAAGEAEKSAGSLSYAWYTVGVLTLLYTFSFVDRQILTLLFTPIKHDLNITDTQVSLLSGIAFAGLYALLGIPIARLTDRGNRVAIITAGMLLWSAMTAVCGLARSFWQLFLARVGVGIGEATLSPAAQRRDWPAFVSRHGYAWHENARSHGPGAAYRAEPGSHSGA